MKRTLDHYLRVWGENAARKSLLVRGARQVGKTFTVRQFGQTFDSFFEVNFERDPELGTIFDRDLDPFRIVRDLSLVRNRPIAPGRTLLFLDEIQPVPRAVTALRYFHEELPDLHVIAAGSLTDFVLEEVGIPVGRVTSLYMYPMSFIEFLAARGQTMAVEELSAHDPAVPLHPSVHQGLLHALGEYLAVGGMPEAVQEWTQHDDLRRCVRVHNRLVDTYRQDFAKYSKRHQIKYVELIFSEIPRTLGGKFSFSRLPGNWRRRELQPAMDLLARTGVVHRVLRTAATGIPLGAEANPEHFKAVFLDVGLAQSVLGFDGSEWILRPEATAVNAGTLAEAFVGQELLAYGSPYSVGQLYYWHREARSSNAEVDYVLPTGRLVVPVEVKSGSRGSLKSMRLFLGSRRRVSGYGVRLATHNFSVLPDLVTYPLYAVGTLASRLDQGIRAAIRSLT